MILDAKKIFQPKIWLLVFALVHTLGMSADLLPVLTDDEAAGTHLGNTVNESLVDDGGAIEAYQGGISQVYGIGLSWTIIMVGGAFWTRGKSQAQLSVLFGGGLFVTGLTLGVMGSMVGDGFDVFAFVMTSLFAAPIIASGILHLEDEAEQSGASAIDA